MEKKQKYALIGYPIAHSGSPALFRKAYDGKWDYDLVEDTSFEKSWEIFLNEYTALNVTAPYKGKAAAAADIQSPEVQATGAANIIVRTENGLKAYNSDYFGVKKIIKELPDVKKILVIGYGGAGKAASQAAKDLGLEVKICNRSTHGNPEVLSLNDIPCQWADLLIYALPMLPPEVENWYKNEKIPYVLEANYRNPLLPPLTAQVSCYISGEKWLFEQAVCGYELLTGEIPKL